MPVSIDESPGKRRPTQIYLHADLQLKEKAMDQTKPVGVPSGRYQPPDELMTFLEAL